MLPLVLVLSMIVVGLCGWILEGIKYQAQLRDELRAREETIKTLKWERDRLRARIP